MIEYVNNISVDDYTALRAAVGWRAVVPQQTEAGMLNSALIIAAKDGDRIVGMARLVTDGGHSAIIEDVIVIPEYQRQGIGTVMVGRIMEYMKAQLQEGW